MSRQNRALRYLAPNLITALGMVFGLLSIVAAFDGRYVDSAWWIVYAVLTDRLDGFVARLVRGTSELGVQLDSFADLITFGVAPAVLVFAFLSRMKELPFAEGPARWLLLGAAAAWVLAATFRLARYNITSPEGTVTKVFFGVPTTLVGGTLALWFLTFAKYTKVSTMDGAEAFSDLRLAGDMTTPLDVWRYAPIVLALGAFLMASSLRMPKLGLTRSRAATAFVAANVAMGYIFGTLRMYPEMLIWPPTLWLMTFLVWGYVSPGARRQRPPPLFPRVDRPRGQELLRPEDDLLPEGADDILDDDSPAPHENQLVP